jgi:serine/threonine-protein kinase RsbW
MNHFMSKELGNNRYVRRAVIDSDTAQGQQIQSDIVALAQTCEFSEPELFAIRLAVEEALVNAIKHGNGSDPSKKVRIDYEIDSEYVRIRIEDEGPGFDPTSVPDPTDPEYLERPCGRGLMLMRHYMSSVHFCGRGNAVEMMKRKGEQCNGSDDD